MGSKKINRENQTKADSINLEALQRTAAWSQNNANGLSEQISNAGKWIEDNVLYTPEKKAEINEALRLNIGGQDIDKPKVAVEDKRGNINDGFTVSGVTYYPDGTPYDSPGEGYSIDQYGRPIPHSWQDKGSIVPAMQPAETTEQQTVPIVPPTVTPAPDSATPALSRASTWADQRGTSVTDSRSFFNTGDSKESLVDTNSYGSKMTGPDGKEIPIEAEKWDESTNSMVPVKQDWQKAKARSAAASAFLNSPAGSGPVGSLTARDAAVGVSRGSDKDGHFLNYLRDGKTYQIRGSQRDMATAAYRATGGENIFGEYDFKELPVSGE